jgi:hypothetical protein
MLPPGHDAWTVGDEPCVFVEFSRGNDYYRASLNGVTATPQAKSLWRKRSTMEGRVTSLGEAL